MEKKTFLNEVSLMWEKLEEAGVLPYAFGQTVLRALKRGMPDAVELGVIQEKLQEMEFEELDVRPEFGQYHCTIRCEEGGPSYVLTIPMGDLEGIGLLQYDSYDDPDESIYDPDSFKMYVDYELIEEEIGTTDLSMYSEEEQENILAEYTFDNDNWEPAEIRNTTFSPKDPDELWQFVEETIAKWETEWNAAKYGMGFGAEE